MERICGPCTMISPLYIFILVITGVTLVSGITLNVSIVIVHIGNWRPHGRASECNRIVVSLAAANVLLQILITYGGILFYSQLFLLLPDIALSSFRFTFQSFIDLCFWNTSWLSACYCLKLVNFSQQVFLWIKSRLSCAVSALLLGSTFGSFLINLPFLWLTIKIPLDNIGNSSASAYRFDVNFSFIAVKITLSCFLPFLLTFFCILVTVKSLLRHIRKIQKNSSDIKYSQLEGHIRAVRTMTLWLLLDLMFCIVVLEVFVFTVQVGLVLGTLGWIIVVLYPSLQSMILITGNPKLMKHLFGQRQKSLKPLTV